MRPTVLKCARLRFPAVSGWDCYELRVSPGDRGIQVQQRCAVRKARLEMFRSGNLILVPMIIKTRYTRNRLSVMLCDGDELKGSGRIVR